MASNKFEELQKLISEYTWEGYNLSIWEELKRAGSSTEGVTVPDVARMKQIEEMVEAMLE